MKKLSLFITLMLCLTITGVYAQWVYTGDKNVADVSEPISINLEDATNGGAHGTYTIEKTLKSATFFRIDQADNEHTAKLVIPEGTSLKIVFTPNDFAPADVKDGTNFNTEVYFTGNIGTFQYEGQNIFDSASYTANSFENRIKITWTLVGDKLECDLLPIVKEQIKLNPNYTFKLDTLSDYNAFSDAIEGLGLTIHVTDGIVAND